MLFIDIDGCIVEFNIQEYVGKIDLFGNDAIRDMEYIIKCVEFMLNESILKHDEKNIEFIKNEVLPFVKNNLLERLKECRDCFLEYDNYDNDLDKSNYLERYKQGNSIDKFTNSNKILNYLKKILNYAYLLIKTECKRAQSDRNQPHLPFEVINNNNDIIREDINGLDFNKVMYEQPILRAKSALDRILNMDFTNEDDDLLTAIKQVGNEEIVDYDEIYSHSHLVLGAKEALKEAYDANLFSSMIALSHHTGPREMKCKRSLFEREFPFVKFTDKSLQKFHTDDAKMGIRRTRSSKALRALEIVFEKKDINSLEGHYLIDDSLENLIAWANAGGYAILFRPLTKEEIATGVVKEVDDPRIVRMYNWSIEELIRVKNQFNKKQKTMLKNDSN